MTPNVSVHESSPKVVESIHGSCLLTRPASSASSCRSSVPAATPHGALEGGGTPSPYAGVVRYPRAPLPTNGGAGSSSSSDRQHIGRGQRGHGQRPDTRERIGAQTARPVQCALGIAPAWALLRQHRGGGLLDRVSTVIQISPTCGHRKFPHPWFIKRGPSGICVGRKAPG